MDNKNKVQSALDATHSASTSQSRRGELYRFLESQTCDPFKCKELGYYFIKSGQDHHRLFGYHCIRKMCNQWNSLDSRDKKDLKDLAIHLFKFNNLSNASNVTLLKEKISELIVTLAIYNWPHEWTNLLPSLFQISQQNPLSFEILFIILKDLYFYCGERQIIPEKRKKQIKDELMRNNKQIMQIFSTALAQCYQRIFENNNNNQENNNVQIAQNILKRCLEALPKYLNQFPLRTILLDTPVLIGLAKILQSVAKTSKHSNVPLCYEEFYRYALLSNIYFFMRKFSELNNYSDDKIEQQRVILTVWSIELETAKGLYLMTHQDNDNANQEENNLALQRLDYMLECMTRKIKLFSKLLADYTDKIHPKKDNKDPKNRELSQSIRDIVLGLSESCMKSCDLRIRLRSMNIWSYLLHEIVTLEMIGYSASDGVLGQSDKFQSIIIGIMKYVLNHFRVKWHDLQSFETKQEWANCRTTLKSKLSHLLQQCFVLSPYGGMECIGQFTLSILNCDRDVTNVNSIGHSTINNERYIALDGLCDVYRIIFENAINYKFKRDKRKKKRQTNNKNTIDEALFDDNSPLINMVIQLHQILLNWTCNEKENSFDTQLMSRIYPILSYLVPLYCRKTAYLQKTFDKLLTDFPKPLPLAPNARDAYDIKCNAVAHKRKIAFALLHIAKRIPHICVQFIEPIWKQVMQIIQANFSTFKSIANENEAQHQNKLACNANGVYMASIMDISEGPLCHLFELLVCISNGLNDTNKRSKVLSDLLKDVIDNFNCAEIQNVLNDSNLFAKMIQFPNYSMNKDVGGMGQRVRFAYHIRTVLDILRSTLTASLLSEGETGLKDLFHTANLDGLPKVYGKGNYGANDNGAVDIASWPLFCAVFANVLKCNKLLSYMYTAEFKSKLSVSHHSIVNALDVKSLYNIYGLKYDDLVRNPMAKPKEILPLEKAVIWIQNVRDYVCRIMAVSSYFNKQFFANKNAMNMMIESVTAYWQELPLSHLSIIIKHFFMNFVQLCSPHYYEHIVEFVYKFLSQCFAKLNKCWQQYINEFMANNNISHNNLPFNFNDDNNRQTSSGLRNEVFHEFALRDASQKLWMAIAMLTISHKERGFIRLYDDKKLNRNSRKSKHKTTAKFNNDFLKTNFPSHVIEEEKENENGNENAKEKKIHLKQDKLVMLILKNENLCKCLFCGIECSLNWLSTSCHIRISQVASKIVAFVAKYKMEYLYVQCGKIFEGALSALSRNVVGDNQSNAELNILCVTICQLLGPLASNVIVKVLQNISNLDMEDAKNLINIITSPPGKHPNVSYRQSIKAFTNKYVIGKQNILSNANKK